MYLIKPRKLHVIEVMYHSVVALGRGADFKETAHRDHSQRIITFQRKGRTDRCRRKEMERDRMGRTE